ncbi:hypothetical protein I5535_17820 [Rhodobacteraceae bacterium F11138]|nr:hypothetical protein [Rhodobacteraceae bacterium F11138]
MQKQNRLILALGGGLILLAGCAPTSPEPAAGVGFGSQAGAMQARELELAGGMATTERLAPPQALSSEVLTPATAPGEPMRTVASSTMAQSAATPVRAADGGDIAAQTAAALAATAPGTSTGAVTAPSGLSAENDFGAVSGSRTIEGDAQRIAINREQYQVIEPTALPERTDTGQPNIVSYALSSSHPRGTRVYSRSGSNLIAKAERNCAAFGSSDQAQSEFLAKGGPQRDRAGLDPDGDGYACGWDPAPFRRAVDN